MMLTAPIDAALDQLANRKLIAYPTETVWGLGALARSAQAVGALRAWKGRSDASPISVLVGNSAAIESGGFVIDDVVRRVVAAFWPGPLTIVLRNREIYAPGIANADGAIGVRCSPHPVASALALGAQGRGLGPITATSLNRSGEPPAVNLEDARRLCAMPPEPWLVEPGDDDAGGEAPSTVLDLSVGRPRLLRAGPIEREALAEVLAMDVDEAPPSV
jgi:L-threonylcarbamoyladenylate synthase